MMFSENFVCATENCNSYENHVPNPQFRKAFTLDTLPQSAELTICGLGYYEVYLNGQNITKGYMAPYRSNPNHYLYYDCYDLKDYLTLGENVLGILLGNGFLNPSIEVWDFNKVPFKSAPKVALCLEIDGRPLFDATSLRCTESPIVFEEFHSGEYYDARLEISGWKESGFCDDSWRPVLPAQKPLGEPRIPDCEPIREIGLHTPIRILKSKNGYIYDFVTNAAGLCQLKIHGNAGQEVVLRYGEILRDGELDMSNISYNEWTQMDRYTLKGGEVETYMPHFTYHGFRFVEVSGITEEQATSDLLIFHEMSSSLSKIGNFICDNADLNALFDATMNSDRANFMYFPTDCPQREKNGWTGDAALSADQFLTYFDASRSLKEWLRNIWKAQNAEGTIPGIVPTHDWGFAWGNGPAWDIVMVELPYRIYQHTGDMAVVKESAPYILKYLHYMESKRDEKGLLHYGLGDYCHCQHVSDQTYLTYTDTMVCKDLCDKAAFLFDLLGDTSSAEYAKSLSDDIKQSFRKSCISFSQTVVRARNQTTQAMAIYYNLFEESEKESALQALYRMIRSHDNHLDTGVLGNRVLYHVLAENGMMDTALKMILNPTFPSFKCWLNQGATALFESFHVTENSIDSLTADDPNFGSLNHHFWGDLVAFLMRHMAGIQIQAPNSVLIAPKFTEYANNVSAYSELPDGQISVSYKKTNIMVEMSAKIPNGVQATLQIPNDYVLSYGEPLCHVGENKWIFCKKTL